MVKSRLYIGINPIKINEMWVLDSLLRDIKRFFGLDSKIVHFLDNIDFAYHSGRSQYHSTEILKRLERLCVTECVKVIAITNEDLFIPILTYVFGEAQLEGKSAIISLYRLKPVSRSPKELVKFQERVVKEALHELGHTFGLTHCRDKSCIMHYCRSIKDVDKKELKFCFFCETFIQDKLKNLSRT